jgi:hypothetical protein
MHTVAFHEINKDNLELALRVGLKRTSRGDKGDDKEIIKTDKLLDDNRQAVLIQNNVSRDDNLYCYFYYKNKIVDITDGKLKGWRKFLEANPKLFCGLALYRRAAM